MPAKKYFKEEFDRVFNEEFQGDILEMSTGMKYEHEPCGMADSTNPKSLIVRRPWNRKYSKEMFENVLNRDFKGDKLTMRRSSRDNRLLYITAVKRKWTTPLDTKTLFVKYRREEFERILAVFGGNVHHMNNSSYENKCFVDAAKRNGWIDRNVKNEHGNSHSVYMFAFPPVPSKRIGISVYVGLTSRNPRDRMIQHIDDPMSSVRKFSEENGIQIPEIRVLDRGLDANMAARVERLWISRFVDIGWNVINRSKGGELGSFHSITWTPEKVIAEINMCNSLSEFATLHVKAYKAAKRHSRCTSGEWKNVLSYINSHLSRGRSTHSYSECLDAAKKCKTYSEFMKFHRKLYSFAFSRGWIDGICSASGLSRMDNSDIPIVGTPTSGQGDEIYFGTINDAARFVGTYRGKIKECIIGKRTSACGYYWKVDDSKKNYKTETREKKGNLT